MTVTAATSERKPHMIDVLRRRPPSSISQTARWLLTGGVVFGAAMIAASAVIHLHLWMQGYKHIHLIGPAFLVQSISGLALAVVLLVYRRLATMAAGAAFCGGSVVALTLSATVGFLGLHDGLNVPWAHWSLATELGGFVVLLGCAAVTLQRR